MINIEEIEKLVQQELKEANEKYPQFHSDHETWAVIKEEVEECEEELKKLQACMQEIWAKIRKNKSIQEWLTFAERCAIDLIREAIQVAAMCEKGRARYDKD